MPLSFGTTPSQVSLFRHLADPKQVSQDTLRELKYKSAKKAKESQLSFGGRNGQSYASRATYINNNNNNNNRREGSIMRRNQSYAGGREEDHDFEPREPKERFTEEKQEINGDEESYEEDAHANDVEEVTRNQESSFPKNSGLTYEMEKSQVQTMIDSEVDREKEHFLAELRKYRGQTTREFSMEDTLTDIQFEYDRLKGGENAANVVRIMGIVLQVVVYAVQWGNGKFGPLLKLDNGETSWAMQTGESISNHEYDNVLEKLYRKHWRKGSMSPEAELGMMLVGSAGVFHFQTHVNEKLSKHSGGQGKKSGGGGGGGGFNLMDLVGPVMGLMGGGGIASSVQPPKQAPVEPPKRFDFVAGRPAQQPSQPPQQAPAAYVPHTQPFAPAAPVPPPPPQGPSLVEMEQQFAKRQQDMLNRMDEVTRRADEQMRASQARQLDLERQLQQTQMRLHQMQSSVQQQQHLQQQQHFQQQHQLHLQFQQQQQQTPVRPKPLERAKPMEPARNIPSVQQRKFATAVNTPLPPPSVDEDETQDIIDRRDNIRDDAPLSPLVELSDGDNGENGDNGDNGEEVDTKFDVKEVMVTEKQRRRKAPVTLEIDELSLAL